MKIIAYEIVKAVSKREIHSVLEATGPGVWTKVLSLSETSTVAILEWKHLRNKFIRKKHFPSTTQYTEMSWKKMQQRMRIYQDPVGM